MTDKPDLTDRQEQGLWALMGEKLAVFLNKIAPVLIVARLDAFAYGENCAEGGCVEMILAVIEATIALDCKIEVVIPLVRWFGCGRQTKQTKWRRTFKGDDADAMLDRIDIHPPAAGVRASVVIAVVDERFDLQAHRAIPAHELVGDVRPVGALLHPDALFNQRIGERVDPDGIRAFEPETFDQAMSGGRHAAP